MVRKVIYRVSDGARVSICPASSVPRDLRPGLAVADYPGDDHTWDPATRTAKPSPQPRARLTVAASLEADPRLAAFAASLPALRRAELRAALAEWAERKLPAGLDVEADGV